MGESAGREGADACRHGLQPMHGRDMAEAHRAATPLELLFDLTFVVGFSIAGAQMGHALAEAHWMSGLLGFAISIFAIVWAWMNYSWFASAYDTDDWLFRIATMVIMVGVIVLAVGQPRLFASIEKGPTVDNTIIVVGYVIMRLVMVLLMLRASVYDARRRRMLRTQALILLVVQFGWVTAAVLAMPMVPTLISVGVLIALEMAAPILVQRREALPWHAHHIAERFSLLAIIALGEVIVGTVATVSAIAEKDGWSAGVLAICAAGVSLCFAMWWLYFIIPSAEVLHHKRHRAYGWAYIHIPIFASIAAVGCGLHVGGLFLQGKAHISLLATVLTVAVPVALFIAMIYWLHYWLLPKYDVLHGLLLTLSVLVLAVAVAMAWAGFSLAACFGMLALAPAVSVIGYEVAGYRHVAAQVQHTHIP